MQRFLGLFYRILILVSSFCMFVLSTSIPRFKFLYVYSIDFYSSFQVFACFFYRLLFLVSSVCMFILPTSIPRFKFLHICSVFPILVSIFEMLALNA